MRTHLQSEWANAYEKAADLWGRDIRYGWMPEDEDIRTSVRHLQWISDDRIAPLEVLMAEMQDLKASSPQAVDTGQDEQAQRVTRRIENLDAQIREVETDLRRDVAEIRENFDRALAAKNGE